MSRPPEVPSKSCEKCDGAGFFRRGAFYDRTFPRCTICDGSGRVYLLKPAPTRAFKKAPMPDPVVY